MAKSENQKLKLLYLKDILMQKTNEDHTLTLKDIQQLLEDRGILAERKSLYNDFELLIQYGLDLESERQGKNTGYHILSRDFDTVELKLLVDAVQASKFISKKRSKELIKKISSLASEYDSKELDRQVYVTNRVKTPNEQGYYLVDYVHTAINKNKRLKFNYCEWNVNKEKQIKHNGEYYDVSPFALTWDDENYYMIGYDSAAEQIKHFRVDKMLNVTVTEKPRVGHEHFKNFDMAIYSKQVFGMFNGTLTKVTLECDKSLAGVIIDRFGTNVMLVEDGEVFRTDVEVMVSDVFLSWVIGFGDKMKIVYPDKVAVKLVELAKKAIEQY